MRPFRLLRLAALLFAVAAASPAGAQVLYGRVSDAADGAVVAGALVAALDTLGQTAASTLSGADGGYELTLPAPGAFRVRVSRIGFRTGIAPAVTVGEGARMSMDLALRADAVQLETVQAESRVTPPFRDRRARGFYNRAARGMGTFMDRDQIRARGFVRTSDLLRTVPELSFRGGSISTGLWFGGGRRGCAPTLYIDGHRRVLEPQDRLDDIVSPGNIWGIEVYRYGSEIPAELPRENLVGNCGAVVIWTLQA